MREKNIAQHIYKNILLRIRNKHKRFTASYKLTSADVGVLTEEVMTSAPERIFPYG